MHLGETFFWVEAFKWGNKVYKKVTTWPSPMGLQSHFKHNISYTHTKKYCWNSMCLQNTELFSDKIMYHRTYTQGMGWMDGWTGLRPLFCIIKAESRVWDSLSEWICMLGLWPLFHPLWEQAWENNFNWLIESFYLQAIVHRKIY